VDSLLVPVVLEQHKQIQSGSTVSAKTPTIFRIPWSYVTLH